MKCPSFLVFVVTTCIYFSTSEAYIVGALPKCGISSIHNYAELGYLDKVKEELRHDKEGMYREDCKGKTPVQIAVEYQFPFLPEGQRRESLSREFILLFIEAGFNVHRRFFYGSTIFDKGNTMLFYAITRGNSGAVKTLLEFGSFADDINDDGNTPLFEAVKLMRKDVCKLLVEYGANISRTFSGGDGYLHRFVDNGTTEQVNLLLELGAPLDMENEQGLTVLGKAIYIYNVPMINVFLVGTVGCGRRFDIWTEPMAFAVSNGLRPALDHLLNVHKRERCWPKNYLESAWDTAVKERNLAALDRILTEGKKNDSYFIQTHGSQSLSRIGHANNTEVFDWLMKNGFELTPSAVYYLLRYDGFLLENLYMVKLLISHTTQLNNYQLDNLIQFAKEINLEDLAEYLSETKTNKTKISTN